MLALPIQRALASDTLQWTSGFLTSTFGPNAGAEFDKDLKIFHSIRLSAISISEASGEVGLAPLSNIIFHLRSIAPRLVEYQSSLTATFVYQDAFKPSRIIHSKNLHYDLSTFMWNFAALNSQIGSRLDRSTDDGIRAANKHFQTAAGALDWISANCSPHIIDDGLRGPITLSLLKMMSMLMLAQAQLCFYEKAVRDRKAGLMKPLIIAKLAAQTSVFYKSCTDRSNDECCRNYIDASWKNHADFQHKCFAAAAEYWQSQAAREEAQSKGCGYGEEVARLIRASSMLEKTVEFAATNKLGVSLTNGAAALQRTVDSAKAAAEEDNRKVYMESVPSDSSLAAVSPVAMAKPLQLCDYQGEGCDVILFKGIQSKETRDAVASIKDKVDVLLAQSAALAATATGEARRQLGLVGLPASLEAEKAGHNAAIPDSLWAQVVRVQSLGGLSELSNRFSDLEKAANRTFSTVESINAAISREERMESAFRERFNKTEMHPPSNTLLRDIKVEVDKLEQDLLNARKVDQGISSSLQQCAASSDMAMLQCTKEELSALLPHSDPSSSSLLDLSSVEDVAFTLASDTALLESKLFELASVIEERDLFVSRLLEIASRDLYAVVSSLPPPSGGEVIRSLEASSLRAVEVEAESSAAQVRDTVEQQQRMLSSIMEANSAFNATRLSDPSAAIRDSVLTSIRNSATKALNLHSQLSSGSTYYSNIQSRLTAVLQRSDDAALTQQLLRQDQENEQLQQFERSNQETRDMEYALSLSKPEDRIRQRQENYVQQLKEQMQQEKRKEQQQQQQSKSVFGNFFSTPPPSSKPMPYKGDDWNVTMGSPLPASFVPPTAQPPGAPTAQGQAQPLSAYPTVSTVTPMHRPAVSDPKVGRIAEMGFAVEKVIAALTECHGNEEEAVQKLLINA